MIVILSMVLLSNQGLILLLHPISVDFREIRKALLKILV